MDAISDNILDDLKKEVIKEVTRKKFTSIAKISKNDTSAKNYAKALFYAASEIDKIDIIKKDLDIVYSSLLIDKEVLDFFSSNFVDGELRINILKNAYKDKISSETFSFISILIERDLLNILFAMIVEYENLCNEYYNILMAKVTTSSNIKDMQEIEKLKERIRNMSPGKEIHFTFDVDESIIGGIIVEMDDVIYDYSVKRLLNDLKNSILN